MNEILNDLANHKWIRTDSTDQQHVANVKGNQIITKEYYGAVILRTQ